MRADSELGRREWRFGLSAFSFGPDVAGRRSDTGEWITNAGRGFAVYGPYCAFPAGEYRVTPRVRAINGGIAKGTFDVFSGGEILVEGDLSGQGLDFRASAGRQVEFRIRLDGDGVIFDGCDVETLLPADGGENADSLAAMNRAAGIWSALHSRPIDVAAIREASAEGSTDDLAAAASALSSLNAPEVIDAWLMDDFVASRLHEMGLSPEAVARAAADTEVVENELRADLGLAATDVPPDSVDSFATRSGQPFADLLVHDKSFQTTLLWHGCMLCPCPWTGATLQSRHSFAVSLPAMKQAWLFYRFEGQRPFYVQVSAWPGLRTAIFIPELNSLIRIADPIYDWGFATAAVQAFRTTMVCKAQAVVGYLAGDTAPALLSGTMNNLGHFFWNDAAGLLQAERAGKLDGVDRLVVAQYPFLDVNRMLSKERTVSKATDPDSLFDLVMNEKLVCVRPTAFQITEEDACRIRELARELSSAHIDAEIADAKSADLLLWVNLRAHNKIWRNQPSGLAFIVASLQKHWPSIAVFLDGTPDCAEMAEAFQKALPREVKTIEGFNLSIADSICWAEAVDAYVATVGSGLTLTTWIADKPGIAHGDPGHLHQMAFWSDVRIGSRPPIAPEVDEVTTFGTAMYSDYDLPPEVLRRLTAQLINEIKASR